MMIHSYSGRSLIVLSVAGMCLLYGAAMGQTKDAVTASSPTPTPKQPLTNFVTDSMRSRMASIAQAPDEPKTVPLADLLAEENKRLKKKIADLEKENAELKQRVNRP